MSDRLEQLVGEILFMSLKVVNEVLAKARPLLPVLFSLSDTLTNCDFLCALADYAKNTSCGSCDS